MLHSWHNTSWTINFDQVNKKNQKYSYFVQNYKRLNTYPTRYLIFFTTIVLVVVSVPQFCQWQSESAVLYVCAAVACHHLATTLPPSSYITTQYLQVEAAAIIKKWTVEMERIEILCDFSDWSEWLPRSWLWMMKGCEADNNNCENNISNNISDSGHSSLCVSVTSEFINKTILSCYLCKQLYSNPRVKKIKQKETFKVITISASPLSTYLLLQLSVELYPKVDSDSNVKRLKIDL